MNDDTEPEFSSEMFCELVQSCGSDRMVCDAARVSTLGELAELADHARDEGLINFLLKNRHMSPTEHALFTWRIRVPVVVMREVHRHRIASYNEESGRYRVLDGLFYIPPEDRPLVQVGKPGAYKFTQGTKDQVRDTRKTLISRSRDSWKSYQNLLRDGIAKEVARLALTFNIYSACYVTFNPRSLMNFLSVRVDSPDSTYQSYPMHEINWLADKMEADFKDKMPLTHAAFVKNGRVGL